MGAMSWLSRVEWHKCMQQAQKQQWSRIVPPLLLRQVFNTKTNKLKATYSRHLFLRTVQCFGIGQSFGSLDDYVIVRSCVKRR